MSGQTPGTRRWLGLAVLALPTLLLSIDVSVLYLALPSIARSLHASPTEQLWILDIYSFVLAGFLVPMGSLGDRIGHRRLLLLGAVAFGVVSVAAAFAPSAPLLIAARAALGVAGATLGPTTLGLLRALFPDEQSSAARSGCGSPPSWAARWSARSSAASCCRRRGGAARSCSGCR